jgi:hypothetical protein
MRRKAPLIGMAFVVLGLSACTAGTAASHHAATGGDLAQLVLGLWHGLIAPVTLIGEIVGRFAPHVLPWRLHLYEPKDTGVAYDVGFFVGLAGGPAVAWRTWGNRR